MTVATPRPGTERTVEPETNGYVSHLVQARRAADCIGCGEEVTFINEEWLHFISWDTPCETSDGFSEIDHDEHGAFYTGVDS